jgi:hypothetical protein
MLFSLVVTSCSLKYIYLRVYLRMLHLVTPYSLVAAWVLNNVLYNIFVLTVSFIKVSVVVCCYTYMCYLRSSYMALYCFLHVCYL